MINEGTCFTIVDGRVGKSALSEPGQGPGIIIRIVAELKSLDGVVRFVPDTQTQVFVAENSPKRFVRILADITHLAQHKNRVVGQPRFMVLPSFRRAR